jgi:hypothetical protein
MFGILGVMFVEFVAYVSLKIRSEKFFNIENLNANEESACKY